MNSAGNKVIVVGAGIVGASVAYHLARAGARVTLLDRSGPASGVTARAFAWINISHGIPEPYSQLRHLAIQEYRRLQGELGAALRVDWCGALTWTADLVDTERFAREHAACGYDVRLVEGAEIARLEPNLVSVPDLAAFAASEGAVDPVDVTETLVGAARDAGAEIMTGTPVEAVTSRSGRITGLRTVAGTLEADTVVMAAGTDAPGLCAPLGLTVPVAASPSILLRFGCAGRLVNTVISNPGMEVRQASDTCLLAAEDFIDERGENGPDAVAQRALEAIRGQVRGGESVRLDAVSVGYRPIPNDGLPIVGFSSRVDGLYFTLMHAGVTLAPVVGRLAAAEILDEKRAMTLDTCRPDRFDALPRSGSPCPPIPHAYDADEYPRGT